MKNLFFLVSSSFDDFKRNKVRTFLTSLGIMIGVLSVVLLIAFGQGLKNYIKEPKVVVRPQQSTHLTSSK